MTKSLVHQLQAEAVDDGSSTSGLLIKAKLVASKLGLQDLIEWIDFELSGYLSRSEVPDYRRLQCFPQAFNPSIGWIPIDLGGIPEDIRNAFTTVYLQESISSVEKHASDGGRLELQMPHELKEMIYLGCDRELRFKIAWRFSAFSLSGVLTTVRNKILTWALDLERQGILGEGVTFSLKEKEIASMVFKNEFNGPVTNNNGVLGSYTGDISQENTMSVLSLDSLRDELKKLGVSDKEVDELHEAIQTSNPPLTDKGFSQKIAEWLGKLSTKAMQGGLKVGGAVAVSTITKLITNHLGG